MEPNLAFYIFVIAVLAILLMALCVVAVYCFSIYTGHVPHFHGKTDVDIENKKASIEVELEEDSKDSKKQDK